MAPIPVLRGLRRHKFNYSKNKHGTTLQLDSALSDEGWRYFPAFCPLMVWRECAPLVTWSRNPSCPGNHTSASK